MKTLLFQRSRYLCLGMLLFSLCLTSSLFGQQAPTVPEVVEQTRAAGVDFVPFSPFAEAGKITPGSREAIPSGQLLKPEKEAFNQLYSTAPQAVELTLNYLDETITLDLVKFDVFESGFKVFTSSSGERADLQRGVHYRGVVRGQSGSLAAISVFPDHMIGVIESERAGQLNLGQLDEDVALTHVLYNVQDIEDRPSFNCGTDQLEKIKDQTTGGGGNRNLTNCVGVYIECEHDMYLENGTVQATIDEMTGIFNVVATLYNNEQITIYISELFVWDTPDTYATSSTSNALYSFRDQVPSYNGDVAHLVSRGAPSGGGVAWVDALCTSYAYAYSYIYSSYSQYPNYSWTVEVFTHEMGHNLGSQHTHDCVWNGNNTAIDGCGPAAGYSGSGNCPDGPLPSSGTIMSYCHLVGGVGIDFTNGFGPQPGDRIRSEITNANCLTSCEPCQDEGMTCDDGDPCTTNDVIDANCECNGTFQDSDGDGVCDADDQCPGFDDAVDLDNDGIPDGCDSCVDVDGDGYCQGVDDPDDNDGCNPDPLNANCDPCNDVSNESFENGFGIWNDGGSDCQLSTSYPNTGSYSVQLRDNSGAQSSMFTDNLDLSTSDGVTFSFSYYPRSMDNNSEGFFVQYSLNGGSSYTTINFYNLGDEFNNDTRYNESLDLSAVSFTSNTRFRIMCDASGNNDWVYIDDVVIEACSDVCVPGGGCDDGDPCTVNDTYNASCACVGTYQDSDGDGVCDAEDQCPGFDDGLIGTSCDDGDPCTVNDVYDESCSCTGTPVNGTNTLENAGDSYVSAQNPSNNYGTANVLLVKSKPPNRALEAYVKFDLSTLATPQQVQLRLHVDAVENAPQVVRVFAVSDDSWSEGSINWNNKPAMGAELGSVSVSGPGSYDLTVTSYVLGEISDGFASFGLQADGSKQVTLSTLNSGQGPELLITDSCDPNNPPEIQATEHQEALEVYPNPARDIVHLKYLNTFSGEEQVEVAVYSSTGTLVHTGRHTLETGYMEASISTSDLPPGSYFLRVQDGENVVVKKLILMR